MYPMLRLFEDVLSNDGAEVALPALPRMIFVVHGSLAIADRTLRDDEARSGEGAVTLKAGRDGATIWRWEFVTGDAGAGAGAIAGQGVVSREKLSARLGTVPKGGAALARRQRCFPAGRLRLSAPASRARHPLFDRRRHPHRYARTFDLIRSRLRVVRKRAGPGVRSGRRPADSFHPRHGLAARLFGKKLGRVSQRGRQGEAEDTAVQDFCRCAADAGGSAHIAGHIGLEARSSGTFGRCHSRKTGRAYLGTKPSRKSIKSIKRICDAIHAETERHTLTRSGPTGTAPHPCSTANWRAHSFQTFNAQWLAMCVKSLSLVSIVSS